MTKFEEFKEFKNDCIEMVLECQEETIDESRCGQEIIQCNNFTELAKVMIDWEYWEMEDAIEKAQWFA